MTPSHQRNHHVSGSAAQPLPEQRQVHTGEPHLTLIPTEPSEPQEPSPLPSMPGRLYRDGDSSAGTRDETRARLKALGVTGELHKRFDCIFAGHEHKARVNVTTAGHWRYFCEGLPRGIGLGEVRAFVAYGHERHISNLEAARWRELLDFEAYLRDPIPLDVELPKASPEGASIVIGRMRLFVGLRDARFPLAEPFVFAHEFAQAYTGLADDRVRAGKSWLERAGVICRAGKHGRSILWKLAAQDRFARHVEHGQVPEDSRGTP